MCCCYNQTFEIKSQTRNRKRWRLVKRFSHDKYLLCRPTDLSSMLETHVESQMQQHVIPASSKIVSGDRRIALMLTGQLAWNTQRSRNKRDAVSKQGRTSGTWSLTATCSLLTHACLHPHTQITHFHVSACVRTYTHTLMHSHTKANNIILTIIFRCIIKIEWGFLGCAHVSMFMCGQAHMCVFIYGTTSHCFMSFLRYHPPCLWRQGQELAG